MTLTSYPTATDTVAAAPNSGWFSIGANATLPEDATLSEAFTRALPWSVDTDVAINGTTMELVPDLRLVRRTDNNTVLGWGRDGFTPIQNSLCEEILTVGLADVDYRVVGIGSLRGGARTFVGIELAEYGEMNIAGDTLQPYMLLGNSFDGSSTLRLLSTAIRPSCTNMLNMVFRKADATIATVRHTRNAVTNVNTVKQAIRQFTMIADEFQQEVARMIDTEVTSRQATAVIEALSPIPEGEDVTKARMTRAENRREALTDLYFSDPRVGFIGTKWGLFQTISTFTQNDSGFRLSANGPRNRDQRKIERAMEGNPAEVKALAVIERVLATA